MNAVAWKTVDQEVFKREPLLGVDAVILALGSDEAAVKSYAANDRSCTAEVCCPVNSRGTGCVFSLNANARCRRRNAAPRNTLHRNARMTLLRE
jgi:hypothetical protein